MSWLIKFLTSSLGRKLIMSLTGLFLCTFLLVHMIGNLKLFADADGHKFNEYAEFMAHNPIIKIVAYGNYFFILLHAFQGILIWLKNKSAAGGSRYKVRSNTPTEARIASRNMAMLGTLILAFILLHMGQFWLKAKFTGGLENGSLYDEVALQFSQLWVVVCYLLGLVALALHLMHGFQSAFQTLGLNHKKYTPVIKIVGWAFSILVPLGYASMPVYFFVQSIG